MRSGITAWCVNRSLTTLSAITVLGTVWLAYGKGGNFATTKQRPRNYVCIDQKIDLGSFSKEAVGFR